MRPFSSAAALARPGRNSGAAGPPTGNSIGLARGKIITGSVRIVFSARNYAYGNEGWRRRSVRGGLSVMFHSEVGIYHYHPPREYYTTRPSLTRARSPWPHGSSLEGSVGGGLSILVLEWKLLVLLRYKLGSEIVFQKT